MKLSELRRRRPHLRVEVFTAQRNDWCFYCKAETNSGTLVVQINNGALRHFRCGMAELGVTERESGTPL